MVLENILPSNRCSIEQMQLVLLRRERDFKYFGQDLVLGSLMKDLKDLSVSGLNHFRLLGLLPHISNKGKGHTNQENLTTIDARSNSYGPINHTLGAISYVNSNPCLPLVVLRPGPDGVDWNPHDFTNIITGAALPHSPQSPFDELLEGALALRSCYSKGTHFNSSDLGCSF